MIVDVLGNPLRLILTGGQVHDITQAEALLASIEPGALLADKGYDAEIQSESETRLRLRALLRAQSRREVLLYNQAFSGDRDAL